MDNYETEIEMTKLIEVPDVKPGIYTTEFWLTAVAVLVGSVMSILTLYGALSDDEAAVWQQAIAQAATVLVPLALYIWSRTQVKTAASK